MQISLTFEILVGFSIRAQLCCLGHNLAPSSPCDTLLVQDFSYKLNNAGSFDYAVLNTLGFPMSKISCIGQPDAPAEVQSILLPNVMGIVAALSVIQRITYLLESTHGELSRLIAQSVDGGRPIEAPPLSPWL